MNGANVNFYSTVPIDLKSYCEMNFKQVNHMVTAKDALILDVRGVEEVATIGKIPHAVIVPGTEFSCIQVQDV